MSATACLRGDSPVHVPVAIVDAARYAKDQGRMADASDSAQKAIVWRRGLSLLRLAKPVQHASDITQAGLANVAAFYSEDDKRVTVLDRGMPLDGSQRVLLLVHEFTHALQDRQYDLSALHDRQPNDGDGSLALSSLIEGDASVTQWRAYATMFGFDSDSDVDWKKAYAAGRAQTLETATKSEDLYDELGADFSYTYGSAYVEAALETGGRDAIDALFRKPPVSCRQVMIGYGGSAPGGAPWIEPDIDMEAVPRQSESLALIASEHVGSFMLEVALRRWNTWAASNALERVAEAAENEDGPTDIVAAQEAARDRVLRERDAWAASALRLRSDALSVLATDDQKTIVTTWRLRFASERDATELSERLEFLNGWVGGTDDMAYRSWRSDRDVFVVAVDAAPIGDAGAMSGRPSAIADAVQAGAWTALPQMPQMPGMAADLPHADQDAGESESPADAGCVVDQRQSCDCESGGVGYRFCHADTHDYGSCVCLSSTTWPEDVTGRHDPDCADVQETCDGRDNDCDGLTDEHFICPSSTLSFSDEFHDSVYLIGNVVAPAGTGGILQPVWPEWTSTAYTGFPSGTDDYSFRMSDGTVFYAPMRGVWYEARDPIEGPARADTTPCDFAKPWFDGMGHTYYACRVGNDLDATVFRDGSALYSGGDIAVVLGDGRFVVHGPKPDQIDPEDYVAVDASGHELARLSPYSDFEGMLKILPDASTTSDNRAYVAFQHWWNDPKPRNELLIFRLDENSHWDLARRIKDAGNGVCRLVLADGTAICPATQTQGFDALLPDGTVDANFVDLFLTGIETVGAGKVLVGPRVPFGPSAGESPARGGRAQ